MEKEQNNNKSKANSHWMPLNFNLNVFLQSDTICFNIILMIHQGATKRLSDSLGEVKRSVGLVHSYHMLPNGQELTGHE